jgi:protoheme IX farnesyltransferase
MNYSSREGRQGVVVTRCTWREQVGDFAMLTKARLTGLVLVTTLAGFLLAGRGMPDGWRLAAALLGTALTALGANALNQWMEMSLDARMERTAGRPLPSGRMTRRRGLLVSVLLLVAGPLFLLITTNTLTAELGAAAAVIYAAVYTPLKTRTSLCTLVGAVSGAIPPVMGWTAATDRLDAPAIILGAVMLIWQVPHFLALAWLNRGDYGRTGFRMLPIVDRTGDSTGSMAVLYSLALVPIGLTGVLVGLGGWVYAGASIGMGIGLTVLAAQFQRTRSRRSAERLFRATLVYLPLLLAFMMAEHSPLRH